MLTHIALFAQVQSYLVLLNRQRVERTQSYARHLSHSPPAYGSQSQYAIPEHPTHQAPLRGRALVINSSIHILQTFMFFRHRNAGVLMCWSIGQQAFNACMIILLDAWETESGKNNQWLVEQAFGVFQELNGNGVHRLAELAVQRISAALSSLRQRQQGKDDKMAVRRRASEQSQEQLRLDTASMTDWAGDTVMGNTGMFLLEDPGLQSYHPQANLFRPLGWNMAGSAHPTKQSTSPTPNIPSPIVPVSQVTAAPFPIMTAPPFPATTQVPVTNSPYAVGLQPRLTSAQRRPRHGHPPYQSAPSGQYQQQQQMSQQQQAMFTPVNAGMQYQGQITQQMPQQAFAQARRSHGSSSSQQSGSAGNGSRGPHRLDRTPRSQQRRR